MRLLKTRKEVTKMKKATISKLNSLHDLLADYFTEAIESGEELSSGTLAAINSFLKTNNIVVDIVEQSPTQNLTFKLKELIEADKERKEA